MNYKQLNKNIMKTNYSINAVPNKRKKTFDIVKLWNDGTKTVYRTTELTEEEFEDFQYNTEDDWKNFLNTSGNYYKVQ